MMWRLCPRPSFYAGLTIGLLAGSWDVALAQDMIYCVTCQNPDQVYRCQVTGAGARLNDAVRLYCIVRTAQEGNHASCKAERGIQECPGLAKVYTYDGPAIPPEIASDPRVQGLVDQISRDQEAFDKPKEGKAPKTMLELGGRAVSASRQGWRNARERLGGGSSDEPVPAPPPPESLPVDQSPPATASLPAPVEEADRPNRMQRAGSAVGGFARKSYRCMTSLFRNCRDEATEGTALQ